METNFTTRWYGKEYLEELRRHEANNLKRACIFLQNDVKKSLGTKSGPCNDRSNRQDKTGPGTKKRRPESQYNRSKPGAAPHLQCGELRRSIAWEVDEAKLVGRVGTNKLYGRYLELGTRYMAPRPFLVPALKRNHNTIASILLAPMK